MARRLRKLQREAKQAEILSAIAFLLAVLTLVLHVWFPDLVLSVRW
jgi:hypothetical protein